MKKWKILALSALCVSCFATATACKEKEEPQTNSLVGFVDETVEIELGDSVFVGDFLEVYDTENNLYRATFELTDSTGDYVTLLKNEFTVQDSIGYTLVLNAHDPKTGEIIATRTVQLKTVDKSAPLITVGDMVQYGVIGQEISVPLIFEDASDDYSTSVSVMRVPYSVSKNGYDESAGQELTVEYESENGVATFTPTLQGKHKIIVEAWDGTDKEEAKTASVYRTKSFYLDVKTSEGEIEGFDLPSSKVAVYGLNPDTGKGHKDYAGNSVAWKEEHMGRYGVVSMKPAKTATYGGQDYGAYYLRSTVQDKNFMKGAGDITKNTLWDYVSMWIYIEGEEGEKVSLCGMSTHGLCQDVPCNTWYEYRVTLDSFIKMGFNSPWNTFSTSITNYDNYLFLNVQGANQKTDYTVHVDSFAYVKGADIMTVTATDSGDSDNKANITVTPSAGYETALANATYTYYVRALKTGSTSAKAITATNGTFTYDAAKWTKYWVCVKVEIDGETYLSHCIYELPTA